MPAKARAQEDKPRATDAGGAPWHCSLGVHLPAAPPTGSCPRRDTRRQTFPRPPRAQGLSGLRVSP
jgi:hypothetical protein